MRSAQARRALARRAAAIAAAGPARSRHPKVVVAARARGGDRRRATRERTARLR